MDEFGFPEDDNFTEFQKYIIGFTVNQYSKSKDKSTSPVDQTPRHSSMSLDYAERSNKAAANLFQDHSIELDRKKTRSMSKINGSMLDLVFELTERRKSFNPFQRSFTSNGDHSPPRPYSRMSDTSIEYGRPPASPIYPAIQVQQLPPLSRKSESLLPILPDIDIDPVKMTSKPKTKKKRKKIVNANVSRLGADSIDKDVNKENTTVVKTPKLVDVVKEYHAKYKQSTKDAQRHEDNESIKNEKVGSEKSQPHNKVAAIDSETVNAEESSSTFAKWQNVTNKLVVTFKEVNERPGDFNVYNRRKSMSRSFDGKYRKSSFCQSSYQERADKERANNIRRRHTLQTKTGPLDFNKLRRQISTGRSQTIVW